MEKPPDNIDVSSPSDGSPPFRPFRFQYHVASIEAGSPFVGIKIVPTVPDCPEPPNEPIDPPFRPICQKPWNELVLYVDQVLAGSFPKSGFITFTQNPVTSALQPKPTSKMSCNCDTNQTSEKSFEILTANKGSLGTALFLIPNPEKGILEYQVVVVKDLAYKETVKRGENCTAFKWVSEAEAAFEEIMEARTSDRCDTWCGPNRDWCPPGCICGNGNYCW